jgi:hypothetical protein
MKIKNSKALIILTAFTFGFTQSFPTYVKEKFYWQGMSQVSAISKEKKEKKKHKSSIMLQILLFPLKVVFATIGCGASCIISMIICGCKSCNNFAIDYLKGKRIKGFVEKSDNKQNLEKIFAKIPGVKTAYVIITFMNNNSIDFVASKVIGKSSADLTKREIIPEFEKFLLAKNEASEITPATDALSILVNFFINYLGIEANFKNIKQTVDRRNYDAN